MTNGIWGRLEDAPTLRRVAEGYARVAAPGVRPVTRFAPSPTGELHLGHVLHAIWVWGIATLLDARVVIRMEDHDRSRCTPEFERSILDDLAWLGFDWDLGSLSRQSDRPERYRAAVEQLTRAGLTYGCDCTRSQLEPADPGGERRYPGTCRTRGLASEPPHNLRVRIPDGTVDFTDLRLGPQRQDPQSSQGDTVIRDALGQWSYHLSVVVDDLADGVNLIIRGQDLLASTGRQLMLAKLLGRAAPVVTVHHPLLYAPDGRKLSKRDRSESVKAMRENGWTADDVMQKAMGEMRDER